MNRKRVVLREQANRDAEGAVDYYLREAGEQTAHRFVDALERACAQVAVHPAAGSSRYAVELSLPGLRVWPLKRYPYLLFYVERDDHVDVWRLLHAERDIPAWLRDPDSPTAPPS